MPDQPPDPIHYDMKIPPEPKPDQAGKPASNEGAEKEEGADSGKQDGVKPDSPGKA